MARLPTAPQGSRPRAAGEETAARRPTSLSTQPLDSKDAEGLLVSLGFLLVPGPPLDRGPAYLLVAVRRTPTLAHFDPERVRMWTHADNNSTQIDLEWPLQPPAPDYVWGMIDVIDRLGETSRFASFGGAVSVARDKDVHAVLFRSDAPILSVGGHSGPSDAMSANVGAFFGTLRAAVGNDQRVADMVRNCSPVALYATFLTRSLTAHRAAQVRSTGYLRMDNLLRKELCRLERDADHDLLSGERLAALISPIVSVTPERR